MKFDLHFLKGKRQWKARGRREQARELSLHNQFGKSPLKPRSELKILSMGERERKREREKAEEKKKRERREKNRKKGEGRGEE